jgi:HAD superfamily hydrolase (TIGR01450 family)
VTIWWSGVVRLEDVRGFVFDVDGTLVHRSGPHTVEAIDGAYEVLDRIRRSGRTFAIFTNGSHKAPAGFAADLRAAGLPVDDHQVITPLCSVQAYLERRQEAAVLGFLTEEAHAYLEGCGVNLVGGPNGHVDVVFVAHTDWTGFDELERAAHAVIGGAQLLTGSYVSAYAGADGPILSRGAMVTAAIAKASSSRPIVVGKPSRAAVREYGRRLDVRPADVAVVGDDLRLDIALGRLGGSATVLVRTGISSDLDVAGIPETHRPDLTVSTVEELLQWL